MTVCPVPLQIDEMLQLTQNQKTMRTLIFAGLVGLTVNAMAADQVEQQVRASWQQQNTVRERTLSLEECIKLALEQKQYSVMKMLASTNVVWLNGEDLFDNAHLILQNINKQEQMKEVNSHDSIS